MSIVKWIGNLLDLCPILCPVATIQMPIEDLFTLWALGDLWHEYSISLAPIHAIMLLYTIPL